MGEGFTFQVLEHKEVDAFLRADVVKNADVGMVQAGHGARLAFEALATCWIAGELGRQDFNGNRSVEAGVTGAIHLAHPACTEWRKDLVRT